MNPKPLLATTSRTGHEPQPPIDRPRGDRAFQTGKPTKEEPLDADAVTPGLFSFRPSTAVPLTPRHACNELNSQPSTQARDVPQAYVESMLDFYHAEHHYVENVSISQRTLTCDLRPVNYPYSSQALSYVNAPVATLYSCQLAYVLMGSLVLIGDPLIHRALPSWDSFVSARDTGRLRYGKLTLRFIREVPRGVPRGRIYLRCLHSKGANYHAALAFDIAESIRGTLHTVLLPDTLVAMQPALDARGHS